MSQARVSLSLAASSVAWNFALLLLYFVTSQATPSPIYYSNKIFKQENKINNNSLTSTIQGCSIHFSFDLGGLGLLGALLEVGEETSVS